MQEPGALPKTLKEGFERVRTKKAAEEAERASKEFIPAPNGGLDYGEITPAMGKVMSRQAGKIRLQQGVQNADGTGWGLAHIEANHGEQIRAFGFKDAQEFVAKIAGDVQQVWQVAGNSQLLLTVNDGRKDVMFIRLEPASEGDFYRVNTAFPVRQEDYEERKGMKKLWDWREPNTATTGQQPAFATTASAAPETVSSQGSSNARGQSVASVSGGQDTGKPATDGGLFLDEGETPTTATGRQTTPFPKWRYSTGRVTEAHMKAVNVWLLDNARLEAQARGDDFNERNFAHVLKNPSNIQQADKDGAELYLFNRLHGQAVSQEPVKNEKLAAARDSAESNTETAAAVNQPSRPDKWRGNKLQAAKVARDLGISIPRKANTVELVKLIDAHDAKANGQEVVVAPAKPKKNTPFAVGNTPSDTGKVTVRDGTVFLDKYEAIDYESGEPVTVPKGSTRGDVVKALRDAGAINKNTKVFGASGEQANDLAYSRKQNAMQERKKSLTGFANGGSPISDAAIGVVVARFNGRKLNAIGHSNGQAAVARPAAVVARTWADMPAGIRASAEKAGYDPRNKGDRILGAQWHGQIYLVQENISTVQEAEETLLHERVHQVLRGNANDKGGVELRKALNLLYTRVGGGSGLAQIASQAGMDLKDIRKQGAHTDSHNRNALVMEEFLATLDGERAYEQFPDKVKRALQEFVGAFRNWLRNSGFEGLANSLGANLNTATLADLRYMLRGVRAQEAGAGVDTVRFLRVWHGTPHRGIEQTGFKLNKIGTGEGAQAYGWGMYFASMQEVAEGYRKDLSAAVLVDGKTLLAANRRQAQGTTGDSHIDDLLIAHHGDLEAAIADEREAGGDADTLAKLEGLRGRVEASNDGQLYGLDLPIEESDLLDWDKPLSEQPQRVRKAIDAIKRSVPPEAKWIVEGIDKDTTGNYLYGTLGDLATELDTSDEGFSSTAQAASELLRQHGIPGLRYLDGNSRIKGEGSHNYVIWDEALLTPEKAQIEAMYSRGRSQGASVATIRQSAGIAYGKLLEKLEAKGLVHVAQTEEDAFTTAAKARAAKTGQSVQAALDGLRQSVSNSVAPQRELSAEGLSRLARVAQSVADGHSVSSQKIELGPTPAVLRMLGARDVPLRLDPLKLHDALKSGKKHGLDVDSVVQAVRHLSDPVAVMKSRTVAGAMVALTEVQTPDGRNMIVALHLAKDGQTVAINKVASVYAKDVLAAYLRTNAKEGNFLYIHNEKRQQIPEASRLQLPIGTNPVSSLPSVGVGSIIRNEQDLARFEGNDSLDVKRSSNGSIEGFFDRQTGKSFLVADGLTEETAPATLMHEVGIHMAADGSMRPVFARAEALLDNEPGEFLDRVRDRMLAAGETSAEEAAAYIVTEYEKDRTSAPKSVEQFIKDFMAAVRAWLFRKGFTQIVKAGSLSVADIAAIARANARSLANGAEAITVGDGARMSRSPSTQAAYEARIDALFGGEKATTGTRVLDRSDVMGLLGHPNVPLVLNESHLRDGMTSHPEMTAAIWKKVPEWIDNPAIAFKSENKASQNRVVLLAPETVAGYPVRLVIDYMPERAGAKNTGEAKEHLLVTAFAKTNEPHLPPVGRLAADGGLLYVDNKIAPELWLRRGVQFPKYATTQGRGKILTEKNLAGYRMELGQGNSGLRFSRAAPTAGAGVWQVPEPTRFDNWTYLLQDKQTDAKQVLNAIKNTGQQVDDAQDVYLQETLYHGRTAKRVKDFAEQEERPLMELMRDKGLSLGQVEEYLHARHAPEANKALAERNPSAEVIAANLKAAQAAGDEGCARSLCGQSLFTIRLHDYSCI